MKIKINDNITIAEMQKEFQEHFPYLRFEFFYGGKDNNTIHPLHHILDETKKLESIRPVHHAGELEFSGEDSVARIENLMRDRFGLNVQVARRSGTQWLLTKETDDFSLNHQNELGAEMAIGIEQPEPEDIHEQK